MKVSLVHAHTAHTPNRTRAQCCCKEAASRQPVLSKHDHVTVSTVLGCPVCPVMFYGHRHRLFIVGSDWKKWQQGRKVAEL